MRFGTVALGLLSLVSSALSQSTEWCDPANGICFQTMTFSPPGVTVGSVFPPVAQNRDEFIGIIVAPVSVRWAGYALGGGMLRNLLIVAWPNAGGFVASPRMAPTYVLPTWYHGPTITTLSQSTQNSTHWKWIFRCQNCTTWAGGSLNTNDFQIQSFASGNTAVDTPSSPNSTFVEHQNFGTFGMITSAAHSANYDNYLNGGPISSTTTTRTTSTTRITSSTSTSPTFTPSATPYDYIVVGAGAAGIVVADRLSETGKKVLLLERGGPSLKITGGTREVAPWATSTGLTRFDVPGLFESMFGSSNPWWWCDDVGTFAGCLTGGGTVINGMLYFYPPHSEFATSNGWPSSWGNVSPYIAKLQARLPHTEITSPDGQRYLPAVYNVVSQLLNRRGYSAVTLNNDPNRKDSVYGHPPYNFKNGIRSGPAATYLQTSKARSNFRLVEYTRVLSLQRNGGRITGVRTNNTNVFPNGLATLTTNGRVILSAGAYGTPRILFASGIGPTDMINIISQSALASHLPPSSQYINLPVGHNVQDNPSVNLVFTHPSVDAYDNWQPIWDSPRTADSQKYVQSRSGVFAYSSPKINFFKALWGLDGKTRYLQGTARPGGWPTTNQPFNETAVFTITFYLSQGVTSKGRIGIDSSLRAVTLVDPWLTDDNDREALLRGIKDVIADYQTILPGIRMITPDNTTTIDNFVNNYSRPSMNSNHWIGSTKIGSSSSNSVVDQNTKVWNTQNLFVVDAGIIPQMPMANPHASVMIVAEQAAEKILALSGGP